MNKREIIADITGGKKSKQASNSKSTGAVLPSEYTSVTTSWVPYSCTIQNFRLVWLYSNIDDINNDDCIDTITKLRQEKSFFDNK